MTVLYFSVNLEFIETTDVGKFGVQKRTGISFCTKFNAWMIIV